MTAFISDGHTEEVFTAEQMNKDMANRRPDEIARNYLYKNIGTSDNNSRNTLILLQMLA